ncbi:MAG TPA: lysophospholipid acyltransferase family protein, partial [Pyrinomonadaceae bacterium]|nr:lysophospholipid acyltransferase family protein [Pyrinomonadaceae bacterium]
MVRRIIVGILRLALRVFFRRIEIAGLERVPRTGALIFVINHPNGLVDPVFILCHAPRRVSFLAKEPIMRLPVIGALARSLDALPVYRHQDTGSDPARNRETFARCRALLKRGGTIAICPEGVSHNEPSLRPLKSGMARIALGVLGEDPTLDLKIVPAGLYYTAKSAFRSAALLYFGAPLKVEPVALEADGEPAREAVRALSDAVAQALREVTLNAEHEQALATIRRAEKIFSAEAEPDEDGTGAESLAREFDLRRRFVAAYAFFFQHAP